jgi:hypothetical protein
MTRRRSVLAAALVAAASLVAGTALAAAVSLSGGFERAASRADLPDLVVRFDGRDRADVERIPGVAAAAERTAVEASAAFALGQPLRLVGFDRGAEGFEAPPLAEGRRRRAAVLRGLQALGARPSEAATATTRNRAFLGVLATVLRIVAGTVALVCLAVLAQALVLTARERRPTLAVLRTVGAGRGALARVLGGACAAVLVPAAALGVALEALVLGPAVASLAAGYAGLSLDPSPGHLTVAAVALAALGAAAVALVGRRVRREAVVAGLREEA